MVLLLALRYLCPLYWQAIKLLTNTRKEHIV